MWRRTSKSGNFNTIAVSALSLLLLAPAASLAEDFVPPSPPKVVTQTEVLTTKNTSPMLAADSAARMQEIASRYTDIIANGGFPKVSRGSYKKGSTGKTVVDLNRRLFLDGYVRREAAAGEFADKVTSATIDGVMRFQKNLGLAASGKVDAPTLAALNVSAEERLRVIQANIPRLAAYGENLGDRYLVVNVPAQQIETVSNGRVYSRHNAIVGRPERPTPVVMTALSDINFNPYWNAPPSIIERDLFPKMKSGTQILTDMNIKVFQGFGGPELDPSTVDWSNAVADDYHFRQEPGPANAMATAKINFSSPFGIYLHDTPEKQLFKNSNRFYSSGCVRVEKIDILMEWVLNGQDGIGSAEIAALAETLERRDVKLTTAPQLRVAYLTAWPVGQTVAFRNDVYDLDGEVSADGQRFTLKPVDRKAAAVEAAEAEGFGLFGKRSGKPTVTNGKTKRPASLYDDGDISNTDVYTPETTAPTKKLPFAIKKKSTVAAKTITGPVTNKKIASKNKSFGLFDWAAYRKAQKQPADKKTAVAAKVTKKSVALKKTSEKVAAIEPKTKSVAVAKQPVPAKIVAPKAAAAPDKKAVVVATKKPDIAIPAKVAAPVKLAVACKPGGVTKDCNVAAPKKPDLKKPEKAAAAN
jgi:L,D-transpeptidase YcbB